MRTVKDLLDAKGRETWSVEPHATVLDALRLMAEKRTGAVLVAQGGRLVGIFSERDYVRRVAATGACEVEAAVRDLMTAKVTYVTPEQTIDECMAIMIDQGIHHLPVLDQNKNAVGIISIRDAVRSVVQDKDFVIQQLRSYIES